MEVNHDDGEKKWTTTICCKPHTATLEYGKTKEKKKYHCFSAEVNLMFAMTIHETQGQTLMRVILLLGRQRGISLGRISWALLYVALSRTKVLKHIRFLPSVGGWQDFEFLTKLKPSSTFTKWTKSYKNHRWNPDYLIKKQKQIEKIIQQILKKQGRDEILRQTNDVLRGYLSGLGYSKVNSSRRPELQLRIIAHMEKKQMWEHSQKNLFLSSKRKRKRRGKSLKADTRKKKRVKMNKIKKLKKQIEKPKNKKHNLNSKASLKLKKAKPSKLGKGKKPKKNKKLKVPVTWLQDLNLNLIGIEGDGNCLFRALAHQLYGNQESHETIRKKICDYIMVERDYFGPYTTNV